MQAGLIPRLFQHLFRRIAEVEKAQVWDISFLHSPSSAPAWVLQVPFIMAVILNLPDRSTHIAQNRGDRLQSAACGATCKACI